MNNIKKILLILSLGFSMTTNSASLKSFNEKAAENQCKKDWSTRGELDNRMYEYCMNKQREGYANAKHYLKEYKSVSFLSEIVSYAQKKWLTRKDFQYHMVAYEIKQQSEGFLDVKYDQENGIVDSAVYKRCLNKWMKKNEPLWIMVKYCYSER